MHRNLTRLAGLAAVLALLCLTACAKKTVQVMDRPDGTLAVAGFTHPKYNWQLLAGRIPVQGSPVTDETIAALDDVLVNTLESHGVLDYVPPSTTRQCQEIVTYRNQGQRTSALTYWTEVGRCMKVDYLLVPQVLAWQERVGEELGVTKPAGVTLDFFYLDVNAGQLVVRRHYDEVQSSLSADLGNAGTFFERGAKWVTALRLAQEGIEMKLTEMGL